MTDESAPMPRLEAPVGIAEKYLWKAEGPSGPCYIAAVGGMPEREHTFVYRDRQYYFYFYANRRWEETTYDVDVANATVSKFTGPTPSICERDLNAITANMRLFFEQCDFWDSSKPRPAAEKFRSLAFSWKLAQ